MTPPVVGLVKLKRPAGSGTWRAYELGSDEHGSWLFSPAGSVFRGSDGVTEAECPVAQLGPGLAGRNSVALVSGRHWWVMTWTDGGALRCAADIATPAHCDRAIWTFVDLELDPYLTRDGRYGVEDLDEFAAACSAGLIDTDERAAALVAESELAELFTDNGDLVLTGERWLARGIELSLEPLTATADT